MKNSAENGYTLSDLGDLALEADIYVNEPARKKAKTRRLKEVIPMLDDLAKQHYSGEPVRIFGVHGRAEYIRAQQAIKFSMSPGQVTGISEGFFWIDYDKLTAQFGDEERHQRLLYELKERAVGSIGISHLIRRQLITLNTPELLSSHHVINRAFAPVASSFLFPEVEYPLYLDEEERLEELLRILSVSTPELAEVFAKLQARIMSDSDPLISLASCAEDFAKLCNTGDANAVSAAHDYLSLVAGPRFFGKIYRFNGNLPPSLIRGQDGPLEICQFNGAQLDMLMVNLVISRELEQRGNTILMNNNNTLYAAARLYEHGAVGPSQFYIPLVRLREADFSVINPSESSTLSV